jgi:hypothetical protein
MTQTLMSRPVTNVVPELVEQCDKCGAQAKLGVQLTAGGELTFCGHHGNRYAEHLLPIARQVTIETGYAWRGAPATFEDLD